MKANLIKCYYLSVVTEFPCTPSSINALTISRNFLCYKWPILSCCTISFIDCPFLRARLRSLPSNRGDCVTGNLARYCNKWLVVGYPWRYSLLRCLELPPTMYSWKIKAQNSTRYRSPQWSSISVRTCQIAKAQFDFLIQNIKIKTHE